jgi:hypothetical protein
MMVELGELTWMVNYVDSLFFLTGFTFLNQLLFIKVYGRPKESLLYCLSCYCSCAYVCTTKSAMDFFEKFYTLFLMLYTLAIAQWDGDPRE